MNDSRNSSEKEIEVPKSTSSKSDESPIEAHQGVEDEARTEGSHE